MKKMMQARGMTAEQISTKTTVWERIVSSAAPIIIIITKKSTVLSASSRLLIKDIPHR